jgi:hypothetical protein
MLSIGAHYRRVEKMLAFDWSGMTYSKPRPQRILVLVARLDRPARAALDYARSISTDVTAVHVTDDPEDASAFQTAWTTAPGDVNLVILESPYRALVAPIMTYINAIEEDDPSRPITVVLSEFVPRHLWEHVLHNQAALRLKLRLFFRPNTVVVDVPYHLGR